MASLAARWAPTQGLSTLRVPAATTSKTHCTRNTITYLGWGAFLALLCRLIGRVGKLAEVPVEEKLEATHIIARSRRGSVL